jgi:3-phosphoshikimate 1-carboxyvinyltransferase
MGMTKLTSSKASPLNGIIKVPGDKSISHRAVMFGALAEGTTRIEGLLEGEDVLATAEAMRAMGASVTKQGATWVITGVGARGLKSPAHTLDLGNSGTSARLITGIIAGFPITATMTGDASLTKRPMKRVMDPLTQMGATFQSNDGKMPLTVHGSAALKAMHYDMPVASAQVKSAILLAGLNADGTTTIREPKASRDHTERMLGAFGVTCMGADNLITIKGGQKLKAPADTIIVPGDPSSAAFAVVAALLVEGSDITIENVGLNPTRTGSFDTLRDMGGSIDIINRRDIGGEPVGDLRVQYSKLKGITVPVARVPSMIDEFPVLFVAAACADGETFCDGLDELRVKESDRLKTMAENLAACGVKCQEGEMSLRIFGNGTPPQGGVTVATHLDHRIAMAHLVLGAVSQKPVAIDDAAAIATSFPDFVEIMNRLGLNIA